MFGAVHSYNEKEKFFRIVEKVSSMKFKSQSRRGDIFKKNKKKNIFAKSSTVEVSFKNNRSSPSILKGPRKINN